MLEFSNDAVDQIAWRIGYEDSGSFRKVFYKVMGISPSAYRKRFSLIARELHEKP
jgi:transcriptional regulator GlxA family with amidase domain